MAENVQRELAVAIANKEHLIVTTIYHPWWKRNDEWVEPACGGEGRVTGYQSKEEEGVWIFVCTACGVEVGRSKPASRDKLLQTQRGLFYKPNNKDGPQLVENEEV